MKVTVSENKKYYTIKTINYGKHYRAKTVLGASKKKFKRAAEAVEYRQRFNDRYDRLIKALKPENFEEE